MKNNKDLIYCTLEISELKGGECRFTHTKAHVICMPDKKINVKSWKDVLTSACEYLYNKDSKKFLEMKDTLKLKISDKPDDLTSATYLKSIDLYVYTTLSAEIVTKNIKEMFSYYGIKHADVSIGITEKKKEIEQKRLCS